MKQSPIKPEEVQRRIDDAVHAFPHDACKTCECWLGYLTQLELDALDDVSDLIAEHQRDQVEMHSCLGCDPCPPGDHFVAYLESLRVVEPYWTDRLPE